MLAGLRSNGQANDVSLLQWIYCNRAGTSWYTTDKPSPENSLKTLQKG